MKLSGTWKVLTKKPHGLQESPLVYNTCLTEVAMSFPKAEKRQGKVRRVLEMNLKIICFSMYICKGGN